MREQREFRPYEGSGIRNMCQGGDSGAPVYFGPVAKGIVSSIAGDNRRCFYSHRPRVQGTRHGHGVTDSDDWPADHAWLPGNSTDREPDPIERYGAEHRSVYAGSYLHGGVLHVGFTEDGPEHLAALASVTSEPLRLFAASRPLAELRAIQDRIHDEDVLLQSEGIVTQTVGVDIPANLVEVAVAELTPERRAFLEQRYGPDIRVIEDAVSW